MNSLIVPDKLTPQNTPNHPNEKTRLNQAPVNLNNDIPPDALTDRQLIAVELLAAGRAVTVVARTLEVDRKTLFVWRQGDAFRGALQRRRREIWSDSAQRLRGMVEPSLDILDQQLHDKYDRVRFRAAQSVLRFADLRKTIAAPEENSQKNPAD